MRILRFDHVQLAIPPGGEGRARQFYAELLGLPEQPKPAELAARGGVWFEAGELKLHLGVEKEFRLLLTFENEVFLIQKELGGDQFEVVYPSISVLAEDPVSVVDRVVDKQGTRKVAQAYLEFLYSDAGQELAVKHHLRPLSAALIAKHPDVFPKLKLFTVDGVFGGFGKAQKEHFDDGATFDQLMNALHKSP